LAGLDLLPGTFQLESTPQETHHDASTPSEPAKRQRTLSVVAGKRLVRFFLSYAHADRKLMESFLLEFQKQCSGAARYRYEVWSDGKILLGEKWRASIERAISECDFGLVLVSPSFLGSEFIRAHELPNFVGEGSAKPILPVGLSKVDLRHHDLQGLQEHQIFTKGNRFFSELRGAKDKIEFTLDLFTKIQERLNEHFAKDGE
jgi:hypothetical protein